MRLPEHAPSFRDMLRDEQLVQDLPRILGAGIGTLVEGRYMHWDSLRHRTRPADLSHRQWWLGIALAREPTMRSIPLVASDGRPFRYSLPDPVLELLHWIDQHAAGELVVSETIKEPGDRQRYLVNSLIEEAITSSQLEGASATRPVAKEMLRTGRPPRDRGERMILNNYRAMTELRTLSAKPLSPDVVFHLHRILTDGTLANPEAAGRLQRPDEERIQVVAGDGTVTHIPPPAVELPGRLEAMCRFAKGGSPGFMHPVVRAVLLHLWLGFDHPFEDGNGRTARALFYREMLAQGYWLFEYVSISRLLLRAPVEYGRSFLYTETDNFDATYFLLYQLSILRRAIEELQAYLVRKTDELRETLSLLRRTDLNYRQVALLTNALRHGHAVYTVRSHSQSHRVTRQSARTDLADLERRGLLERGVVGRRFDYYPASDIRARLAAGAARPT
jgi:Fic family protein